MTSPLPVSHHNIVDVVVRPNHNHPHRLYMIIACIISTEFCERLAFYSLSGNLTIFMLRDFSVTIPVSATVIAVWIGMMYSNTVVVAYISDTYLTRFTAIVIAGFAYLVGLVGIAICTILTEQIFDSHSHSQSQSQHQQQQITEIAFWISLFVVGFAAGGIKANVGPFGADQIRYHFHFMDTSESSSESQLNRYYNSYWNWIYFAIQIGSGIAILAVSYIAQDISFSIGYMIPAVSLALAMAAFLVKWREYDIPNIEHKRKTAIPPQEFCNVLCRSCYCYCYWCQCRPCPSSSFDCNCMRWQQWRRRWRDGRRTSQTQRRGRRRRRILIISSNRDRNRNSMNVIPNPIANASKGEEEEDDDDNNDANANVNASNNALIDIENFMGLIPFALIQIFYWTAYTAQSTLFVSQGCQMNMGFFVVCDCDFYYYENWKSAMQIYVVHNHKQCGEKSKSHINFPPSAVAVGGDSGSFQIPIASMAIFDNLVVLLLIPLVDRVIYPLIESAHYCHWRFTLLKRIGFGMVICSLSLVSAGVIEIYRKRAGLIMNVRSTCNAQLPVSDFSILWQIPSYFLLGASEVFTMISSYDFFYNQAPASLKSLAFSLVYVAYALGSWMQMLLVVIVNYIAVVVDGGDSNGEHKWIGKNLNHSHAEYYFFLVALLVLVSDFLWIHQSMRYQWRESQSPSEVPRVRGENDSRVNEENNDNENIIERQEAEEEEGDDESKETERDRHREPLPPTNPNNTTESTSLLLAFTTTHNNNKQNHNHHPHHHYQSCSNN